MTQNASESSLELINHKHIINPRACSATVERHVCNVKVSGSNPDKSTLDDKKSIIVDNILVRD